jgi:hypothetical protein
MPLIVAQNYRKAWQLPDRNPDRKESKLRRKINANAPLC